MDGAHGVLLSIQGGSDLGLFEINEAARLVQEAAHPEANIIFGAVIDDALGDEVRVTVIAAGFDGGTPTRRRDDRALGQISGRPVPNGTAPGGVAGSETASQGLPSAAPSAPAPPARRPRSRFPSGRPGRRWARSPAAAPARGTPTTGYGAPSTGLPGTAARRWLGPGGHRRPARPQATDADPYGHRGRRPSSSRPVARTSGSRVPGVESAQSAPVRGHRRSAPPRIDLSAPRPVPRPVAVDDDLDVPDFLK